MFDFSAERTLRSVDESLQRMGLDFVDIIQVISFFALYNVKSSIVKIAIHCKHKSKTMNLILMINITKEC